MVFTSAVVAGLAVAVMPARGIVQQMVCPHHAIKPAVITLHNVAFLQRLLGDARRDRILLVQQLIASAVLAVNKVASRTSWWRLLLCVSAAVPVRLAVAVRQLASVHLVEIDGIPLMIENELAPFLVHVHAVIVIHLVASLVTSLVNGRLLLAMRPRCRTDDWLWRVIRRRCCCLVQLPDSVIA